MDTLIVARYNEDLSWLVSIPEHFRIIVYNKGREIQDAAAIKRISSIVNTPNVGRESDSYLRYLEKREPCEQGLTVFSQGNPIEHSPDFSTLVENEAEWADIQALSWCWKESLDVPPKTVLYSGNHGRLLGKRARSERFSLVSLAATSFHDKGSYGIAEVYRQAHGLTVGTNLIAHFLNLCALYEIEAAARSHVLGEFAYGAIFAAKNTVVNRLDPSLAPRMREVASSHFIHGYLFEKLWLHIFGLCFKCKEEP